MLLVAIKMEIGLVTDYMHILHAIQFSHCIFLICWSSIIRYVFFFFFFFLLDLALQTVKYAEVTNYVFIPQKMG